MRLTRLLPWLLLAALVVFSVAVYEALPAQLPKHVDLSGRVAQSAPKSPLGWGMLPLVALGVQLLLEGMRRRLPQRPELFNFPGKEELKKLPREYHPPVVAKMQRFLDIAAAMTTSMMIAVQVMLWHTARGGTSELATMLILMSGVFITPLLFLVMQGVNDEVDAARKQWESRRNPLVG